MQGIGSDCDRVACCFLALCRKIDEYVSMMVFRCYEDGLIYAFTSHGVYWMLMVLSCNPRCQFDGDMREILKYRLVGYLTKPVCVLL